MSGKDGNHSFLCLVIEALAKISETNDRLSLNQFLAKLSGSQIEIHLLPYLTKFVHLIRVELRFENKRKLHLQTFESLIKFLLNYRQILPYASREKIALILLNNKQIVFNTAFNLILISLLMLSIFQKINGEKGMFAMQSSLSQLKSIQINSKLMNSQVLEFLTLN